MVQILESNDKLAQLAKGISTLPDALGQYAQRREERGGRKAESESLKAAGYNIPSNIKNPQIRNALLNEQKLSKQGHAIEKTFGKEAGDLYKFLTPGGQTKYLDFLLEDMQRTGDLEKSLGNFISENPQDVDFGLTEKKIRGAPREEVGGEISASPNGVQAEQASKFPKIDLQQGRTLKERNDFRKEVRKENVPLKQEATKKIRGLDSQEDHLKVLKGLSEKIGPSSKFKVNKHGQIRPTALMLGLASKDEQRFVKTVNDFITGAKDIFGSRVTNFDIQQFNARLPSLMNSKEGRDEIIEQMEIFTEIERDYYKSLNDVYKHYGLDNIPQERAEEIAESIVAPKEEELRRRLHTIGSTNFDLNELPDPSTAQGRTIEDEQGNRFRSNGSTWEPL